MGISDEDMKEILSSSLSSHYHLTTKKDIEDYHGILNVYGYKLMHYVMVMEQYYGIARTWIIPHINDYDMNIKPPQDMIVEVSGEHSQIRFIDYENRLTIYKMLKTIGLIDADMYSVVKHIGWKGIYDLCNIMDIFPYREYKSSRKVIYQALHDTLERNGSIWILDILQWIVNDRPFFKERFDVDWIMSRIDYPSDFTKESYDIGNTISIDDYNDAYHHTIDTLNSHINRMNLGNEEKSACHGFIDIMSATLDTENYDSGKTRLIASNNLERWYHIVQRLQYLPDEFFDIIKSFDTEPDINVWNIYADVSKGADIGVAPKRTYNNGRTMARRRISPKKSLWHIVSPIVSLKQKDNVTLCYAESTTYDRESMIRWAKWIRAQFELRNYNEILVLNDSEDIKKIPFYVPNMIKVPDELISWIHDGIIPRKITYGTYAELTIPKYVHDILAA
jgi:hypothetical protein